MTVKLLFLAGSARKASFNKKLAKVARDIAESQGAQATFIDLADYDMPIFNEDFESENGLPENAKKVKQLFIDHDGFFIASPEYNSSFSPLLKNTLDWISRKESDDEPSLVTYSGKTACICGASPGGFGGLRGLVPLRMLLSNISVHVIPQQLAIPSAHKVFDDNGNIINDSTKERLESVLKAFVKTTQALKK